VGPEATLQLAVDRLNAVRREIAKVIVGQDDVVEGVLICLLASGHVLLEGVPGLGKTTLLRTLARVLHLRYSRIQFTPDLMPADIVGSMMIETGDHGAKSLRFQPGPIFAKLRQVAVATGGRFNPAPREVFDAGGRSIRSTMELWPGLLALAIALNLAERVGGRAM
jgi:MoxR-like ATPase